MEQKVKSSKSNTAALVASLPFYTEGPAIDRNGNFYCTTLSGRSVLKMDAKNNIMIWAESDCPNGQIILPSGDHLICDVKRSAIRRFNSNGTFIRDEIQKYCAGVPFDCPNDLVSDKAENIYFTDSIRNAGKVCYVDNNGEQHILLTGLDYPNGIILSSDEKTLYVAESYKNRILKISLEGPGKEAGISVLIDLPAHSSGKKEKNLPDGLALDCEGNVWVAHYGMQSIHKISPEGNLLRSIDVIMPLASNLFFINQETIVVTGGFGEPGPGGVARVSL
jgi:gluconolactonase